MERGGAESTGPTTASRKARGQGIPTRTGKLRRPGVLPPDPPSTQLLEGAVTQREAAHPCPHPQHQSLDSEIYPQRENRPRRKSSKLPSKGSDFICKRI